MADERLDGGSATQLTLNGAEDAALLARSEDAAGMRCMMPAISLVDVDPFDFASDKALSVLDSGAQRMAVVVT
jgi:hypothetical protein